MTEIGGGGMVAYPEDPHVYTPVPSARDSQTHCECIGAGACCWCMSALVSWFVVEVVKPVSPVAVLWYCEERYFRILKSVSQFADNFPTNNVKIGYLSKAKKFGEISDLSYCKIFDRGLSKD